MSEPSFYIRDRGNITGPFSLPDLKKRVSNNALSKISRVSSDPADPESWVAASTIPELFPPPRIRDPKPCHGGGNGGVGASQGHVAQEPAIWHYVVNELETAGPVTVSNLKAQILNGLLPPDVSVWRDGFEAWQVASTIPELGIGNGGPSGMGSPPGSGETGIARGTGGGNTAGALLATLAVVILLVTATFAGLLLSGVNPFDAGSPTETLATPTDPESF